MSSVCFWGARLPLAVVGKVAKTTRAQTTAREGSADVPINDNPHCAYLIGCRPRASPVRGQGQVPPRPGDTTGGRKSFLCGGRPAESDRPHTTPPGRAFSCPDRGAESPSPTLPQFWNFFWASLKVVKNTSSAVLTHNRPLIVVGGLLRLSGGCQFVL